jgi:6-pyruvoyltetrahydropterin/6-carboxytetrahydropterin synthase
MFAIEIQTVFCAAHALRAPGEMEPFHGHNFEVTVKLACQKLEPAQTVADFQQVRELLEDIVGPWNNQTLNLLEPFQSRMNPSAERVAEQIGQQMQAALEELPERPVTMRGLKVVEVRLTEAPGCVAIWQA